MEINAQVNTFNGGMNCDVDVNYIDKSQYRYGQNIRIITDNNGTTSVLQNIEKNKQYSLNIEEYQNIIGTVTTKWFNKELQKEEDCAVIITADGIENDVMMNTVYLITGFDKEDNLIQTKVVTAKFNLSGNLSIVANYESQYVSNVYFTDGNGMIKVINLQNNYDDIDYENTAFDIIPDSILQPFEFKGFGIGSLPTGQVQYAYKLFNKHGVETSLSPLSKKIPLSKGFKETDSQKVKGQKIDDNTGLSCEISTKFLSKTKFDYIRIYRIFYSQNNQIPDVTILSELAVSGTSITFSDNGSDGLSMLSSSEVNDLIPFQFKAKTLETMDNRLFAANIQNDDWDVEFDARAYRCDINGNIVLDSSIDSEKIIGTLTSNGTINVNGVEIDVPETHDCINPSNVDLFTEEGLKYQYGKIDGKIVKGGSGPNVSYRFLYTELVQSSTTATDAKYPVKDLYMRAHAHDGHIATRYDDDTIAYSKTYGSIIPNYASAQVCANYTGYRRDEIYRFGIVFYNQKMVPSPVHWIGDIRMPAVESKNDKTIPFKMGKLSSFYAKQVELQSEALGIEFTVNNIPEDVVGYEIVRCDRTENDSTIVTQGAVSRLINFDDWGAKQYFVGEDVDTRPQMWLNIIDDDLRTLYRVGDHNDNNDYKKQELLNNYFEFVSPEISISKELFLPLIQNSTLCDVYWCNSMYPQKRLTSFGVSTTTFNIQPRMYCIYDVKETSVKDVYPQAYDIGTVSTLNVNSERMVKYIFTGWGPSSDHPNEGFAAVFKYYEAKTTKHNDGWEIKNSIIGKVLPTFPMTLSNSKQHVQLIGEKKYVNLSIGGEEQFANHGINCILQLEDDSFGSNCYNQSPFDDSSRWFLTTRICNIKQNKVGYGGNYHSNRTNSVYISCGAYSTSDKVMCYGGDTYLNIFEYQNTTAIQHAEEVDNMRETRICTVCYIPLESSSNLNLRHDESYSRTVEGDLAQNLIQNDIHVFPNTYAQDEPLYLYNPVYSAQVNIANFVSKSLYAEDDLITSNRIICSEQKINNEIIDSWSKFKFANYLDVDTQYGPITNLKVFKNKLYYFQDNAVGVAAVNERSLITDNNPGELTLGTGGILVRYDYLLEHNGDSIVNDRSIISSNNALYWFDYDKNVLCQLGQGFLELSKAKNVQSYLNSINKDDRTKPLSLYDAKYNEIQFKITDKNIVFNENLQVFTSFYTHVPSFALQFSDKLVTIKQNKFFLHNQGYTGLNYAEELLSKVKFVVNDNAMYTKVYDNQWFSADFIDDIKVVKEINTTTKHQTSEPIYYNNIDYREDTYRFAIPREQQMIDYTKRNKSYAGRMRGKYLICDYTFDCSDDKEFRLPYIKTTYRYSML